MSPWSSSLETIREIKERRSGSVSCVKHSVSTWWQCCTGQLSPDEEDESMFHPQLLCGCPLVLSKKSLHSQTSETSETAVTSWMTF